MEQEPQQLSLAADGLEISCVTPIILLQKQRRTKADKTTDNYQSKSVGGGKTGAITQNI